MMWQGFLGLLGSAWNATRRQLVGLVSGIVIGVIANSVFQAGTSRIDEIAYRDEAFTELLARLDTAQRMSVTAFAPQTVFDNVRQMNENTKSETGNPKFEGKRFANLIYDLRRLAKDKAMSDLLERLRYIENDIPINETDRTAAKEGADKVNGEISDYYCCISVATGQGDAPYCKLPQRLQGQHWCFYDRGDLYLAPGFTSSLSNLQDLRNLK